MPNFTLIGVHCRPYGAKSRRKKKQNFDQVCKLVAPIPTPFSISAKFGMTEWTSTVLHSAKVQKSGGERAFAARGKRLF